jgi:NADH-quinone oxidoreductase subunit J
MTVTEVLFYFIAGVTVLFALGVVATGKVAYAAISLVFTLLAVAALYILLASEFLALVQVLLYAGGVAVLLLFALMLTRARELVPELDGAQKPFAVVAGLSLLGVLIATIFLTTWPKAIVCPPLGQKGECGPANTPVLINISAIGDALFRTYALPFEVASLVLLVALVGAIVLARSEDEEEEGI